MSTFAKLDLQTNEIVDVFDFESETLPEIMGNPSRYVLSTESTGVPSVGGTYDGYKFLPVKPYESWVLVDGAYKAPVNPPEDFSMETNPYKWDETTGQWVQEAN